MVCPHDEYSKWHTRDYLLGTYENYGVNIFPICLLEEKGFSNILVSWKHYSIENILTKKGEEKKKLIFLHKSSSFDKLINYLKLKLQYLKPKLLHWQSVLDGGFHPKNHWIWSDEYSSQFMSKISWFFVTWYPYLTDGCNMTWNFFWHRAWERAP
jgi:hypothetical protein